MNGTIADKQNTTDWPCLLCHEVRGEVVSELTGRQLLALWKETGHEFSAGALGRITNDFRVVLKRCHNCGFVFNDPSLAGGEKFYQELENKNYFSSTRQEFARTLKFAGRHHLKRVLDVGCGSGIFLDQARRAGLETHGLELNKVAAAEARGKGHDIFEGLLDELAGKPGSPKFDLITFFQVVEHLADPVKVLKDAAALLAPNGYISVAVPSAQGVYRIVPWDPSQWPPHHVSRWRIADFERMAQALGLKLADRGGDRLVGSEMEFFWKLHNRLAGIVGSRPHWGGDALAGCVSWAYRKTGMKYIFSNSGPSIYGFFGKP
jgi:SAM-dependent methyltransferase